MRGKKNSPLKTATAITAVLLVISVAALFVTGYGDFSINRIFDTLIFGKEADGTAGESSVTVNIIRQNSAAAFRIDDELESKLHEYFRLYYSSLGELSTENTDSAMGELYGFSNESHEHDNAVLRYNIDRRKKSGVQLTYAECDVTVAFTDSNIVEREVAEIVLMQGFETTFDAFPAVRSGEAPKEHFFVFYYTREYGWQIDRHEDRSIFGRYAAENEYMLKEKLEDYKDEFDVARPETEYPYDRAAAVKYALEISQVTGAAKQSKLPRYDDNSMNYVSQCINAGGIPMDAQGTGYKQWKWYTDELNHEEQSGSLRTGYSRAWVSGESFYRYITENTGFGIVAEERPLADAEKGDVIQFLDKNGGALYQCIITGKYESELLLSANSEDIENMPISALGFDEIRVIKIYGYNTN